MGGVELFVATTITGASCINLALAAFALDRSRDARFLLLAAAHGLLAGLGGVWAWGAASTAAPTWTEAQLPVLGLVLGAVLLFLVSTVVRRPT